MLYKKLHKFEIFAVLLTSVLISLVYASLNFNYLSGFIDEKGDVLTYDYYVRLGIPEYLYNPHHIGFDWLGQKMYSTLKDKGYKGSTMTVLQIRNLIISSIGLGVIFFLFYAISKKFILSFLIVATYSFTAAYWMYSQINDTPIIHSILVFILFLAVLYYPQAKRKLLTALLLGIFHAIIIFFHQSDLIMMSVTLPVILFYHYFIPGTDKKKLLVTNCFHIIVYLLSFTIIVVTAYYYVGVVLIGLSINPTEAKDFNNIKNSTYFFNWLILYAQIDYWGKGFEDMSLFEKSLHGISTYFYQPASYNGSKIAFNFSKLFTPHTILPNFIGILFINVLCGSILFFKGLFKRYGVAFIAVIIFMVVYTVFTCWWEADYREFWVAPMFSFWFLMLLFYNYIIEKSGLWTVIVRTTSYSFIFLLAFLLFFFNFTGFIQPNIKRTYATYEIIRDKQ